jgi:hypothetical protein
MVDAHIVTTNIPAGPHGRFAESALTGLDGQIVTVEFEGEKREVGRITGSRLVDEGRAIQVEMEIGDPILCEHLRG